MKATRTLPSNYRQHGALDLSRNKLAVLGMNVVGGGTFFLFGLIALELLLAVRKDAGKVLLETGDWLATRGTLAAIVAVIVLQVIMVILHEAIHGAFFWL